MTRTVFLATTRTGSDPRRHEMYELAVIERADTGRETTHAWWIRPTRLPEADPTELQRTRFFERPQYTDDAVTIDHQLGGAAPTEPRAVAATASQLLFGAAIVTIDPAHDLPFVTRYLTGFGYLAHWATSHDMTSAARWSLYGLRHGWYAAARHTGLEAINPPPLDYDLLDQHAGDPFVIARIMGVRADVLEPGEAALTRASLARELWDALTTRTTPLPVPRPAMPPPSTGDLLHQRENALHHPAGVSATTAQPAEPSRRPPDTTLVMDAATGR